LGGLHVDPGYGPDPASQLARPVHGVDPVQGPRPRLAEAAPWPELSGARRAGLSGSSLLATMASTHLSRQCCSNEQAGTADTSTEAQDNRDLTLHRGPTFERRVSEQGDCVGCKISNGLEAATMAGERELEGGREGERQPRRERRRGRGREGGREGGRQPRRESRRGRWREGGCRRDEAGGPLLVSPKPAQGPQEAPARASSPARLLASAYLSVSRAWDWRSAAPKP
jgi:hypothetical protein